MDNHYHFLLRQGDHCLSVMFGPILGAYAQSYNKRHNRVGYLFQGRFKSILCEENTYLLELIRYIHLNPLKAGIVENLSQLADYQWTGHHSIIENKESDWFVSDELLSLFGKYRSTARQSYIRFLQAGITSAHNADDYEGGGVVRSIKNEQALCSHSTDKHRRLGDERILGGEAFVTKVLKEQGRSLATVSNDENSTDKLIAKVCDRFSINRKSLLTRSRNSNISEARAVLCYWGVKHYGMTTIELSAIFGISHQAVSKAIKRGMQLNLVDDHTSQNPG